VEVAGEDSLLLGSPCLKSGPSERGLDARKKGSRRVTVSGAAVLFLWRREVRKVCLRSRGGGPEGTTGAGAKGERRTLRFSGRLSKEKRRYYSKNRKQKRRTRKASQKRCQ